MKRTDYANLVLVSEEDLNNSEHYRVQAIKERFQATLSGYSSPDATSFAYYGIVKEPVELRFSGGADGSILTGSSFTATAGSGYTRFDPTTTVISNPLYNGGERIGFSSSQITNIKHASVSDVDNYIFLVYVEVNKNQKYDESGVNAHFVDREDGWIFVQMTQAEATTFLASYPNGSITISNVEAPQFDTSPFSLTNVEKDATFPTGWSTVSGVFTVNSVVVTHYNSVFMGKVEVTSFSPVQYRFYHSLPGTDPLYGSLVRPTFSIVDQFHRSQLGRGTPSNANPHGELLWDITGADANNIDHRVLHHSNGIMPKNTVGDISGAFTSSLGCAATGNATVNPNRVNVTQIVSGEYAFVDGKRVTTITNTFVDFTALGAGTYFVYLTIAGGPVLSDSYPYEYYQGTIAQASSVPTSNALVLCSVYWNGSTTLSAFNGDTRYSAASTANPVMDLRVFGVTGYDKIHSTLYETNNIENLIPFGGFEAAENNVLKGWAIGTPGFPTSGTGANLPASGTYSLKIASGTTDKSLLFPFDANSDYAFRFKIHTAGATVNFQANLIIYRGKDRGKDRLGYATLDSNGTYSNTTWTLRESEFLSATTINWDGAFTDRNAVGWAALEITSGSGIFYIDEVILRPKIRTKDVSDNQITEPKIGPLAVSARTLNADVCGYAITKDGITGKLDVVADEASITVDTSNSYVKVKAQGITTSHVDTASEIGRVVYDGTSYKDSVNDTIGNALRVAFGGTTYYVPASLTAGGVGCGCTCTCTCTGTCGCTCTCKGTSWN